MKNLGNKILGGVLIGSIALCSFSVDALEDASKTVSVGSVDTPTYQFEMDYSSLEFDWKYDATTDNHQWQNACKKGTVQTVGGLNPDTYEKTVYTDANCSTKATATIENGDDYYYIVDNSITITDKSSFGKLGASVTFTPSTGYDWVQAGFYEREYGCKKLSSVPDAENVESDVVLYSDSTCSTETTLGNSSDYYIKWYDDYLKDVGSANIPTSSGLTLNFMPAGKYTLARYYNPTTSKYVDPLYATNTDVLRYSTVTTSYPEVYTEVTLMEDSNITTHDIPTAGDQVGTITIHFTEN